MKEELSDRIERLAAKELKHVQSDMFLDFRGKFLELPMIIDGEHLVEGVLCNRYQGNGYLIAPSPQVGCCVRCDFCNMYDVPYKGSVSADAILEQIACVLNRAIRVDYKVFEKPLKISFVKGGEGLLNSEFPRALELIAESLGVPIKVSTTFPDVKRAHDVYQKVEQFAGSYTETVQMQISLISTDEIYRSKMTRLPLLPFRKLGEYGERWHHNVPDPRKMTLTFTLTEDAPCDPQDIVSTLSPEFFAIRIRDWMPTEHGLLSDLNSPTEKKIYETVRRFEDLGYMMIPGKPGSTESKFGLTAGHLIKLYQDLIQH